jgi:hypothetical protein
MKSINAVALLSSALLADAISSQRRSVVSNPTSPIVDYGVVFDAGSSGTAGIIFKWMTDNPQKVFFFNNTKKTEPGL